VQGHADAAPQEVLPLLQAHEQGVRGKEPDAGGRQFERQGQPIQAPADLGNGQGILRGQLKIRGGLLSTLAEEGDRARTG